MTLLASDEAVANERSALAPTRFRFGGKHRDRAPAFCTATFSHAFRTIGVFLALLMICDRPLSSQSVTSIGRKVDVGGYSLWIQCSGVGSPTVVLDAGMGDPGDWKAIIPGVQSRTRICSYNRAGLGQSDPPPKKPRTSRDMVRDLHALLINARVPGPYVLVGHSIAGYNIRVYAGQYPREVAGMVMIDCTPTDYPARWLSLLPPVAPDEPKDVTNLRLDLTTGWTDPAQNPEEWDLPASAAQVRASVLPRAIPLVFLTAGRHDLGAAIPATLMQRLEREAWSMDDAMAKLSTNSTHIMAAKSGHGIHQDQPELVVRAILEVVAKARNQSRVRSER